MLDDLSRMGDQDFIAKWNVSRVVPIKLRKRYGIQSFNLQHGTYPHEFRDGQEYKWCGSGHWELIENFGVHSSRYDGLRGHCKEHSNDSSKRAKQKEYSTPEGKSKIRTRNHQRKSGFILWEREDELRAFDVYKDRCGYCGTKINFRTVEFDHFIPISRGGKTVPSNMIPSCVRCNRGIGGKKAQEPKEWIIKKFGEDIGLCIFEDILEKQKIIEQETKQRVDWALKEMDI